MPKPHSKAKVRISVLYENQNGKDESKKGCFMLVWGSNVSFITKQHSPSRGRGTVHTPTQGLISISERRLSFAQLQVQSSHRSSTGPVREVRVPCGVQNRLL